MSVRASTRLAWFLFGVALLILAPGFFLSTPNLGFFVTFSLISTPFALVGALVASRRPRNPIGWLFLVFSVVAAFVAFANRYARYAIIEHPDSLPGGEWVAWVASGVWHPAFGFFVFAFLLFPDGRLPSPRWRPVAFVAAANYLMGATLGLLWGPLFEEFFPYAEPPFRLSAYSVANAFFTVFIVVNFALLALSAVSLVLRLRRSSGVERQQLKWFVYAVALFALVFPPSVAYFGDGRLIVLLLPLVPAAAGVAILKHRLYDIDPIINRTLVYGALTAIVVAVYILIVGYLGAAFRTGGNLFTSLVATSIVAMMFTPLRDRLQKFVNRLMYGERDDPYAVLSRLGERLENALAPEAALATVAESVAQALKLPYAAVALEHDGRFVTAAEFGALVGEPVVLPLTHHSEEVGRMVVSPRSPGEEFSPADRRLLDDLSRQAGAAAHAARLTADLKRSRERLVAAREEERRRLRRDLHDGLGPRLATLALKHDAAMNLLSHDPEAVAALLAELKAETQEAIADVRRVVHNLRPPALDQLGLVRALEEWTHRRPGGTKVCLDAPEDLPPTLPAAVEVAAYRIVQEAVNNVARHADARNCAVRLALDETAESLLVEVSDDGRGIGGDRREGVGLSSMRERAEELGGSFGVEALSEGGTRVRAGLPLRLDPSETPEESVPREGIAPPAETKEAAP